MRRLRWLILGIGISALLLIAVYATFGASAEAAILQQTEPPTASAVEDSAVEDSAVEDNAVDAVKLPVPPASWIAQPIVSPTLSAPATATTPASSNGVTATTTATITGTGAITGTSTPTYYVVLPGDTLFVIATRFSTTVEAVMVANELSNADNLNVDQLLLIPSAGGALPDPALLPSITTVTADGALTATVIAPRGTITERMTSLAQQAPVASPYYGTTWLTYYGRPNVPVMGILGEYAVEELVPLLRAEAAAYDQANGAALEVMPAFHLVYGMATKAAGADNSYLGFMEDDAVLAYIEAAEAEGWSVILDVQIGALAPTAAITPALGFLEYPNVHLAIDPEFAMVRPNQSVPGDPIGYVTAQQVNQVQAVINTYLAAKRLPAPRILLVHQFQSSMIVEPEKLDTSSYARVALTLSVDGWGGPWGKISKYNSFVTPDSPYSAFKLFYRWDEPLLTPDEALGNQPYGDSDFFIDVTPNLIIYQ